LKDKKNLFITIFFLIIFFASLTYILNSQGKDKITGAAFTGKNFAIEAITSEVINPPDGTIYRFINEVNLTCQINSSHEATANVTLYDAGGIILYNDAATDVSGNFTHTFVYAGLAPGEYKVNCKGNNSNAEEFYSQNHTFYINYSLWANITYPANNSLIRDTSLDINCSILSSTATDAVNLTIWYAGNHSVAYRAGVVMGNDYANKTKKWEIPPATLADGTYLAGCFVNNTASESISTENITFTLNNDLLVNITRPFQGEIFNTSKVEIACMVNSTSSPVTINYTIWNSLGAVVSQDTSTTISLNSLTTFPTIDLYDGNYTAGCSAENSASQTTFSANNTFAVDTKANVTTLSPANGSNFYGNTFDVICVANSTQNIINMSYTIWNASNNVIVSYDFDATMDAKDYSASWPVTLSDGDYIVRCGAINNNTAPADPIISYGTNNSFTIVPIFANLTKPQDGLITSSTTIEFEIIVNASKNAVIVTADFNCTIWNATSGLIVTSRAESPGSADYTIPWNQSLSYGDYLTGCYVNDSLGNDVTTSNTSFKIMPLYVEILSPLDGFVSDVAAIALSCKVNSSTGVNLNMTVWDNTGTIAYTSIHAVAGNSTTSDGPAFPEGQYSFMCLAENLGGYFYNSTNNTFYVDLTAPIINLISPTNTTTTRSPITFTYNLEDLTPSNCSLILNNAIHRTSTGILTGQHTFTENLNQGDYNWSVNCTDQAGRSNQTDDWLLTVLPPLPTTGGSGGGGRNAGISYVVDAQYKSHEQEEIKTEKPTVIDRTALQEGQTEIPDTETLETDIKTEIGTEKISEEKTPEQRETKAINLALSTLAILILIAALTAFAILARKTRKEHLKETKESKKEQIKSPKEKIDILSEKTINKEKEFMNKIEEDIKRFDSEIKEFRKKYKF
jgi:hypothetical protein